MTTTTAQSLPNIALIKYRLAKLSNYRKVCFGVVRLFFRKVETMRNLLLIVLILVTFFGLSACRNLPTDQTGPLISDIKTSGNVLVISDCSGTSVEISAKVTDPSGVARVLLLHRIGADQPFISAGMVLQDGTYKVTLKGSDFLGKDYGTLEFYITAKDGAGNLSESPIDQSIQFLPCVNY
jgi:hypothetical protein